MSLLAEYGPRYGGVLLLIAALAALVHFRHRREHRLASGWRLAQNESTLTQNMNDLSTLLLGAAWGAWFAEWHHLSGGIFFLLFVIVIAITPREKWVGPGAEPCR
ncbi:hypothetical protein LLG95_15005 [bacterium]|nr:hypothetical protein [bacterium]